MSSPVADPAGAVRAAADCSPHQSNPTDPHEEIIAVEVARATRGRLGRNGGVRILWFVLFGGEGLWSEPVMRALP